MIVIVGGGLIGLASAYELAKRGAQVRVIESGEPARAASWAGAGMLAPYTEAHGPGPFEDFCAQSLAAYPAFVAELHDRGGVDARLRLDGILDAAFDQAGERRLAERIAGMRERGLPAEWIPRTALQWMEPAFGPAVLGAAWSPVEGQVDNRRLGRALRAACEALGVRIEAHVGTVTLEADARRALGVRTATGFVPAEWVVNAAGAWAGSLGGVPASARVPVIPVKGQMLALAPPRDFIRRVLWVPGAYLVPRDDGRLLIGATVEDAGFDVRVTANGLRELLDAALEALPVLGTFAVAETWSGLRPGSPDGLPFVGATSLGGYLVATGHYRNGILLAPLSGRVLADAIEGVPGPELAAFSPLRLLQEAPAGAAN